MCYSFICYVLVYQHFVCWSLCEFPYIPRKQEKRNQFFLKINKVTRGPSGCRAVRTSGAQGGYQLCDLFPRWGPGSGLLGFWNHIHELTKLGIKGGLRGVCKKKLKWDQQFIHYDTLLAGHVKQEKLEKNFHTKWFLQLRKIKINGPKIDQSYRSNQKIFLCIQTYVIIA